jgi:hypothetical protein
MITIKKWPKVLLATLALGFAIVANAEEYEESRSVKRSFPIDNNSYVEIENKYGRVEIATWDKDSVLFEVEINVKSDDSRDLDEMIAMIQVDFTTSTGFILAKTSWADEVSFFRQQIYKIGREFGSDERIEINYLVHIPSYVPMDIKNSFGDVFIGDYQGDLEIEISHGDLRGRNIRKLKNLTASYGKVKISEIGTGRLDLSYVKSAEFDTADDLYIKSTSSEIEIERVNKVQLNSRHDEIVFGEVTDISGFSTLTDFDIGLLVDRMDITSKMGEVRVREVGQSAQLINLEGNNTNYQLTFSPFFASGFDVNVSDPKEFSFSEEIHIAEEESGDKEVSFFGWVGDNSKSKVSIKSKGGYVKFDN